MSTQGIYGGVLNSVTVTANKKAMPTFNKLASVQNPTSIAINRPTQNVGNTNLTISDNNPLKSQNNRNNLTKLVSSDNGLAPIQKNTATTSKKSLGQWIGGINDALGSKKGQNTMSIVNSALDVAKGFVPTQESKGKNPTGFEAQQAIGDTLTKVPIPIVQAAGLAYKGVSMLAEATNSNVNTITKEQADNLDIKGERIANNIVGTLFPFAGRLNGDAVEEGQKSHLIDEMSNAYADTVSDINQAEVLGGGRYLFGKKKIANAVSEANRKNELLTDINMTNTMRKQSDYGRDLAQQNMNRYAGTNYMDMRMGRKGMKIQSLEEIRELLKNRVVEELDVQKFAEGGSLMPAGKLHKELSHINELGEQYEDLTRKGIPVITLDEGGALQQVAEVERDEWIWNLEFTQQIEALWKDGSEEAMIEAGKLLTEELLRNTDDISGIIHKEDE